jgi:cytochrome c5
MKSFVVPTRFFAGVLSGLVASTAFAAEVAPHPGDATVKQVCSACHGAGLMGAPKIGDTSAWQKRLTADGSVDGLVASAAHGKNAMPPRGGQSSLSDADLKLAIVYMLGKSGIAE